MSAKIGHLKKQALMCALNSSIDKFLYWTSGTRVIYFYVNEYSRNMKVKCYLYRPDVAQRVGRGIALIFHNRGTRSSSTPRPHFYPPGKTR